MGSDLLGLAFLFVARGRDNGLTEAEILWIVENQIFYLDMIESLKNIGGGL